MKRIYMIRDNGEDRLATPEELGKVNLHIVGKQGRCVCPVCKLPRFDLD